MVKPSTEKGFKPSPRVNHFETWHLLRGRAFLLQRDPGQPKEERPLQHPKNDAFNLREENSSYRGLTIFSGKQNTPATMAGMLHPGED